MVTAQVGAGASMVLFTTGLGTPTGNPIAPVVKLSNKFATQHNGWRYHRHAIPAESFPETKTIAQNGRRSSRLRDSGGERGNSHEGGRQRQEDFIPWKRGIFPLNTTSGDTKNSGLDGKVAVVTGAGSGMDVRSPYASRHGAAVRIIDITSSHAEATAKS